MYGVEQLKGKIMKKYAKIINEETKEVQIGVGCSDEYYQEIGMMLMDVEVAYNGLLYVEGYAPQEPELTKEEIRKLREHEYQSFVDPITSHINRLKDEEQTEEIIAEIEILKQERSTKVKEIKEKYPYPEKEEV
jgi:hypothetical protein